MTGAASSLVIRASLAAWAAPGYPAVGLAVGLACLVGLVLRLSRARIRTSDGQVPERLRSVLADSGITLVQVSSVHCGPCRQARSLLTGLVAEHPDLTHVEVDVDEIPSTGLGVRATPTTVVVDRRGRELLRVTGVPRPDELMTALAPFRSPG